MVNMLYIFNVISDISDWGMILFDYISYELSGNIWVSKYMFFDFWMNSNQFIKL